MPLQYSQHDVISLKKHPEYSEKWLQKTIADNPVMLGLGDVEVIGTERIQEHGGRLDLLLFDGDNTRYEVELMLGETDPNHIIRCILYWDTERRRYPGYEHIAVLIAENITTRFLNVMSLMAGNIPMIAIQLCALSVGNHLVLNFVPVLDQTSLRRDDIAESTAQAVDRQYWDAKVGAAVMGITDGTLALTKDVTAENYELQYAKPHIGISLPGSHKHAILIFPKKKYAHLRLDLDDPKPWISRFEELGLPVVSKRQDRLKVTITPQQFDEQREVLRKLLKEALVSDQVES